MVHGSVRKIKKNLGEVNEEVFDIAKCMEGILATFGLFLFSYCYYEPYLLGAEDCY